MRRATLAWLIGWYALIPPLGHLGAGADRLAPLARWEQIRAFDTAEACEQMAMGYAKRLAGQLDDEGSRALYRQVQYVRCVHVSDPRLAE